MFFWFTVLALFLTVVIGLDITKKQKTFSLRRKSYIFCAKKINNIPFIIFTVSNLSCSLCFGATIRVQPAKRIQNNPKSIPAVQGDTL